MAGLDPAIHALFPIEKDVDGRHKAGHDVERLCARREVRTRPYSSRPNTRSSEYGPPPRRAMAKQMSPHIRVYS